MQCRGLAFRLRHHFRLVYAEAPFVTTTPGPDVLSVYAECGPFKRWVLTVEPNAVEKRPEETWKAIDESLRVAMGRDEGDGEWVGVLGFSQGAKIAGSLLLRLRERGDTMERILGQKLDFKVGVLMAGRGPFLPLVFDEDKDEEKIKTRWMFGAGDKLDYDSNLEAHRLIRDIPTIHVHGLQDPGIDYHRVMLEDWCQCGTTTLIEWEGNHRLPLKTGDVVPVVDAMVAILKREGVALPGV